MQESRWSVIRAYIRPAIEEALSSIGAEFELVSPEAALGLRSALASRFCGSEDPRALHWNSLRDYQAVQHPEGWQWVDEFVQGRPALFFAHIDDEPTMFSLASGTSLSRVIGECPGFEFYVADATCSYLLCENMHDYLLGAGGAKEWIVQLTPRHDEWVASLAGSSKG